MTSYLEAVRWDWLGSGFQITLCAGILFGWVRRRVRQRSARQNEPSAVRPTFSQEVFLQVVRQQTELAWQNIQAVVEAERGRLQRVLAGGGGASLMADAENSGPADALVAFRWGDPEPDGSGPCRYDALDDLAEQGLSTRQIAERINRPVGEIELALKMRRGSLKIHPAEAIRQ
jgi:hypothetical protein